MVSTKLPVEEKPNMSSNIDWSTVPVEIYGDIQYQECRNRIRLKQGNSICITTWGTVIRLSQLPIEKQKHEIATLSNSPEHREMIHSLIDLYRTDIIKDPDFFARPLVNIDTSTNYDGGKMEMEEIY